MWRTPKQSNISNEMSKPPLCYYLSLRQRFNLPQIQVIRSWLWVPWIFDAKNGCCKEIKEAFDLFDTDGSGVVGYGLVMLHSLLKYLPGSLMYFIAQWKKVKQTNVWLVSVLACVWFFVGLSLQYVPALKTQKKPNDWKALNLPIYPLSPTFQVKSIPKSWKLPWGPWVLNPRRRRSRRWFQPLALWKNPRLVHVDGDLGREMTAEGVAGWNSLHVRNVSALLTLVIDTGFNSGRSLFGELFELFVCFGGVKALLIFLWLHRAPGLSNEHCQIHVAVHFDWRSLSVSKGYNLDQMTIALDLLFISALFGRMAVHCVIPISLMFQARFRSHCNFARM